MSVWHWPAGGGCTTARTGRQEPRPITNTQFRAGDAARHVADSASCGVARASAMQSGIRDAAEVAAAVTVGQPGRSASAGRLPPAIGQMSALRLLGSGSLRSDIRASGTALQRSHDWGNQARPVSRRQRRARLSLFWEAPEIRASADDNGTHEHAVVGARCAMVR